MVGTKEDLRDEMEQQGKPVVSTEMGEEMASHINAKSFIECSAKDSYHVQDVFQDAILTFILQNSTSDEQENESKNCNVQ